jgi:hypothetical protein
MEKNKAQAQVKAQQAQAQAEQAQAQAQQAQAQVSVQKAPVQTRKNGFSILETLMEEEEVTAERLANEKIEAVQKVIAHQQAFPAMGKAKTITGTAQAPGVSWAALAAKPKAQAPKAQAPAQAPKAQAKIVDPPYDDEDPEMLKHFRKTVAVLFREKEKDQEDNENTHSTYSCGYSWADE